MPHTAETHHAELLLKLTRLTQSEGEIPRANAQATLTYIPASPASRGETAQPITSDPYPFTDPLGILPLDDLRWYLESYAIWPGAAFRPRAQRVEAQIQSWGEALYQSAIANHPETQTALAAWEQADAPTRRFSIQIDTDENGNALATYLLALPWELLHNGEHHLFQGPKPARVRRRLPRKNLSQHTTLQAPIRVLLVTARPEDNTCSYIDHRVSAEPLVAAMEALGDLVDVTLLQTPTFEAMTAELRAAAEQNKPYHVLHFDGHGTYSKEQQKGGLVFEHPASLHQIVKRRPHIIYTDDLTKELAKFHLPLVFLEACQTATAETEINGMVAGALLQAGVSSVVAMSHSVLVETARRFVKKFYAALAEGTSVGDAMLAGQRDLQEDPHRGRVFGAGNLELQDWFVPVLFQAEHDPILFNRIDASKRPQPSEQTSLNHLPKPPPTGFIGRSQELLSLQRLLFPPPDNTMRKAPHWALVIGQGGEGKTALATEFARWSVRARLTHRAAFVSVELHAHEEVFLLQLGLQLIGDHYLPAHDKDQSQLIQALKQTPTILVIDNCESLEPDYFHDDRDAILTHCQTLIKAAPKTRLLFTSRESLPHPFATKAGTDKAIPLHRLSRRDATQLIQQTLNLDQKSLTHDTERAQKEEIDALIDATQGHARTLSLLAPHIKADGMAATTQNLTQLMKQMERDFPGNREHSLFASIELSLQRLSPQSRELCKPLGLFNGAVNINIIKTITQEKTDSVDLLALELIATGLATSTQFGHRILIPHPALCIYFKNYLTPPEEARWLPRWTESMKEYVREIKSARHSHPKLTSDQVLTMLPNFELLLNHFHRHNDPPSTVSLCTELYEILQMLGQPRIINQIEKIRETAKMQLNKNWSRAQFETRSSFIYECLQSGELRSAKEAAQGLLAKSKEAGPNSYKFADFDLFMAENLLGRVLSEEGNAEEGLTHFQIAKRGFESIAGTTASRMARVCQTRIADSLHLAGRNDEAVLAYKKSIEADKKISEERGVAVGLGNLGSVYSAQNKPNEALEAFSEARKTFEKLNEPLMVAVAWHQIGNVLTNINEFEKAEAAYRHSIAINTNHHNLDGLGRTYNNLGILYTAHRQTV